MPRDITVTFADGTAHTYQGAPDTVTPDEVQARAEKQFAKTVKGIDGGRAVGPAQIPGTVRPIEQDQPEGILDKIKGAYVEAPMALATGLGASAVGAVAGLGKSLFGGKYGTPEGVKEGQQFGNEVAGNLTYQPRTQTGKNLVQSVGNILNDSGMVAVAPLAGEMSAMGRAAPVAATAATDAAQFAAPKLVAPVEKAVSRIQSIGTKTEPQMQGMGAASVEEGALRAARAADLPFPIQLTKGQRERSFEQQRFERETAKLPKEGAPIRYRMDDQNEAILNNFDAFAGQTGAEAGSLRAVGEVVNNALLKKVESAKLEIRQAYNKARQAGELNQPVEYAPLAEFLKKNEAAATTGNAPMLNAMRTKLEQLDPQGVGKITLNDMEELRQMAGRLSTPGTPNSAYIGDVKKLIDGATQGQGGVLYQQARRMYENYSNQFKNTAVIDKMLRNKPGTKDRTVAYEDIFDHAILRGSLDDVRAVRRTLQNAGTDGMQAWKELQGQTVNHIKDTITSNVARDQRGNPVVSPDKLNKLVTSLDADGKLDFIFGKQGGAKIRDLNELAKDIYTSPPGAVNSSNTASVLIGLLDTAVSGISGIPMPIGSGIHFGVKKLKADILHKQVSSALGVPPRPH